jgi:hypothetical protein
MGRRGDHYLIDAIGAADAADAAALTDDEARGIELALEQYRRGQFVDAAQARRIFDSKLERRGPR